MCRTDMTAALRAAGDPVSAAAADAIDALVDVLVTLHAYHDVPGEKDAVLARIFNEGADALRLLDIPTMELNR